MNETFTYSLSQKMNPHRWSIRWRKFKIKVLSWEYWPAYIFNIPVLFTWLWFALKNRDLFFFTLANPAIPTGGLFGESKSQILQFVPEEFRPRTVLWEAPVLEEEIEDLFQHSGLTFPVIAKPEIGERGWLISPLHNMDELKAYIKVHPIDLILQPFIEMPLEVSIMVYSNPADTKGDVTSICQKEFLHVTGDGVSTIQQLILDQDRALLQYDKLMKKLGESIYSILPEGEYKLLEPVGNHCRGTKFINRNDQIDNAVRDVMVGLLRKMKGFHYGRFDMKITSWEELRIGKGIQVLEFNGVSSEPAHIFHPGYSLVKAYRDIFHHWQIMAKISEQNRGAGHSKASFRKILSDLIIYFRYKRTNN